MNAQIKKNELPRDYPYRRSTTATAESAQGILANYSSIDSAWQYSASVLRPVKNHISDGLKASDTIATVAIAGSYGRMEAGKQSDFDYFVVANDGGINNRQDELALVNAVWRTIESLSLVPPDDNGIFTRVLTPAQLCDPAALGNLDYPRHVFGLRLQLLMDAQPLYGGKNLEALQKDILAWYCQPGYSLFSTSPLQYMVSDIKRYYHSYAVWHQFRLDKTFNDSWLMRQIKMNHSRLASYVSLLICLLGAANRVCLQKHEWREQEVVNDIAKHLKSTPLERLIAHWPEDLGDELEEFLRQYDHVTGTINDVEIREKIIEVEPESVNDKRSVQDTALPRSEIEYLVHSVNRIQQLLSVCVLRVVQQSSKQVAILGGL